MTLFDQMLSHYEIKTNDDYNNALHEVMQQVALAGLYRGEFFNKAAFYGGTCLRIFHQLPRFSEDMDFSLLKAEPAFSLEDYFPFIIDEFRTLGRDVIITQKNKSKTTNIESAFLKDDTEIYQLQFKSEKKVKIKLEVDVNPPPHFKTESKLLLQPFSFMTSCYVLPDLYAGKMHAMLFRTWKNRVKGRDWYDFEWYVKKGISLNFNHFCERAFQFNQIELNTLTVDQFKILLKEKIVNTNIEQVKADVMPFVKNISDMNIWSTDYFCQLVDFMKIDVQPT